jgi:hypothetical protein
VCSHSGTTGTITVSAAAGADITDVGDCSSGACFTGSSGDTLTGTGTLELAPGGTSGVKVMDGGSPYLFTIGSGTARRRYSTVYDIYFDDWYSIASNNAGSFDLWGGAAALQSYGARISVHGVSDTDDSATVAGDVVLATANNAGAAIELYDKDQKLQCSVDENGVWVAEDVIFEGATADAFETTLTPTDATADRTITLPDATGTVALIEDIDTEAELESVANVNNFLSDADTEIIFEGATADDFEMTLQIPDVTADRTVWFADESGYVIVENHIDTEGELETISNITNIIRETEIDTEAELEALVTDVTNFWNSNDNSIEFEGATADAFETTLTVTDPSADRTITLPNATGLVITDAQIDTEAELEAIITDATELFSDDDTSFPLEGATDDGFETTLSVTDPTADATITIPNQTGTMILSTDQIRDLYRAEGISNETSNVGYSCNGGTWEPSTSAGIYFANHDGVCFAWGRLTTAAAPSVNTAYLQMTSIPYHVINGTGTTSYACGPAYIIGGASNETGFVYAHDNNSALRFYRPDGSNFSSGTSYRVEFSCTYYCDFSE